MQLPWRQQIVEGMLGADLVGFQRPGRGAELPADRPPARRRRTPTRTLIPYQGRTVQGRRLPGLDRLRRVRRDRGAARDRRVRPPSCARALGSPRRILLGVDRLDYTKGIDVRLQAFRELLESGVTHAARRCSCRSRRRAASASTTYRQLRERVERAVGRINGEFGRLGHPAIHYQHHNLPREDLCALYARCRRDARDPAARRHEPRLQGVRGRPPPRRRRARALEFAGAAGELRQALLVNPHDVVGHARDDRARDRAARAEARRRMRELRRQVRTHDVAPLRAHVPRGARGAGRVSEPGRRTATEDARAGARAARARAAPARRLRLRRHARADRRRARRGAPAARVGRGAARAGRAARHERAPSSRAARCTTSPRSRGCPRRSTSSAATAPSSTSASRARSRPRRSRCAIA